MSNHSSSQDNEMQDLILKQLMDSPAFSEHEKLKTISNTIEKLGATNKFPEGKLTPKDEGEIRFAVGQKDGKIIIEFGGPVHWMGMLPEQARALGRLLISRANSIAREKGEEHDHAK